MTKTNFFEAQAEVSRKGGLIISMQNGHETKWLLRMDGVSCWLETER